MGASIIRGVRTRARWRGVSIGACILGAGALLACPSTDRLFSGGDEPDGSPATDAEVEAAPEPDAAADAGCRLAHPPSAPAIADNGVDLGPLVFAARAFTLTPPADAGLLGYDLDNACTCQGGDLNDAAAPCVSARAACDDSEGRDIVATRLVKAVGIADPITATNAAIASGLGTTLFVVEGYNGALDDPSVVFTAYLSSGIWPTTPDGTAFSDDGGVLADGGGAVPIPPKWDGTDRWTLNPISAPGGAPTLRISGWVTGGVLVAPTQRVPGYLVPVGFGAGIDITEAVVTARIVKNGDLYELVNAQFAGRLLASQLLGAARTVSKAGDGGGTICTVEENQLYPILKAGLCASLDIMQFASADGTGRTCNALSSAIGFSAAQARIGLTRSERPGCVLQEDSCQ